MIAAGVGTGRVGPPTGVPRVAVLMATYNGAQSLLEQLDSLAAQTLRPWLIVISDDGSQDETGALIDGFAARHPDLRVRRLDGPRRGAAQNFLSLLRRAPDRADVVALSDQDDVWLPEKLQRGVAALGAGPPDTPRLYCARTWECDADLANRRLSRLPVRPPGFRNALVQNIAAGNTIMLNRAAVDLAQAASFEARKAVVHDWWLYQVITGAGGEVIFDPEPVLLYRQHRGNLIGANRGISAQARRLRHMLGGRFHRWNTINILALLASRHRLTPDNAALVGAFARARRKGLWTRVAAIRQLGLYRQGLLGQVSLYLAAVLGKM